MSKTFSKKNSSGTIEPKAERIKGFNPSQGHLPENERNSATGVQTRLLRFHSPSLNHYTTRTPLLFLSFTTSIYSHDTHS